MRVITDNGPYTGNPAYKLNLDEVKTIVLALNCWSEQIKKDGDHKTDAVMQRELDTIEILLIDFEREERRLEQSTTKERSRGPS